MGFRFKRKEDFKTGFARIATEQFARAGREWKNSDRAVAVHETRKCLKRLRSLLLLVRPALEPRDYRDANASLREIARSLSVSRDRQVMLETISFLTPDATPEHAILLERLREQIAQDNDNAPHDAVPNIKTTAKAIGEAGKRIAVLELNASGFDVVAVGFERAYRQGRERMADLISAHSDEASHDWRKRVQAHWRQLELLAAPWPAFFQTRVAMTRQLSDALGHDHDLAVLAEHVRGHGAGVIGGAGVTALLKLIERRQQALRRQTLTEGMILFADRPKTFARLVRRYWEIAGEWPKSISTPYRKARPHRQIIAAPERPSESSDAMVLDAKPEAAQNNKKLAGKS